jgi:hypothetical protein
VNSFPDCLDGVPGLKSRVDFGEEAANETASRNRFFTAKSVNYVPSRSSGHGDHQKSSEIIENHHGRAICSYHYHQKSSKVINNHHFFEAWRRFQQQSTLYSQSTGAIGT